jgi:hypothetical protein
MSIIFFVNVWRKNIFDIYVTEYGTALTNILPIKHDSAEKRYRNYAYVLKNGVGRFNLFFEFLHKSCWILLCRFRVEFVNMFIYNMCFFSANNFAHAQTLYRMRSLCRSSMVIWSYSWIYEYYAGKHWMLYWMQENQTATYFLRSRLFTYNIMKNCN